jgi:hypothetical protein
VSAPFCVYEADSGKRTLYVRSLHVIIVTVLAFVVGYALGPRHVVLLPRDCMNLTVGDVKRDW